MNLQKRCCFAAGLRSLGIQVYGDDHGYYDHNKLKERIQQTIRRLRLDTQRTIDQPDEWIEEQGMYGNMSVRVYARNFLKNGCNRGENISIHGDYIRRSPCLSPFHHLYIDFNGSVMPCCNLRSDVAAHREFIVFDLQKEPDIFAAYANSALVQWRRGLVGFRQKEGVCRTCRFVLYEPSQTNAAANESLIALIDRIPVKAEIS